MHHAELAATFVGQPANAVADSVARATETLHNLPAPMPLLTDTVKVGLSPRIVEALHAYGTRTLADLTVRVPRRCRCWSAIARLSVDGARRIEEFSAAHPAQTERPRALIVAIPSGGIVPWE
ncbi:phage integrase family protein [Burkholderia pseudomallei]|uniref:phage integrase family protein n=1 Tax=Burkholderia pseudomallei TaxID=28450 RepID=UPI00050DDF51|nr:phage integrase family protein [Burkholderia pseudomallei]